MSILRPGSIRILVVEDDTTKFGKIERAVLGVDRPELVSIAEVRDAMSARRLLEKERFDLLILDLRIPNRVGDEPDAREGANLLREVTARPKFKRPYHIIGVTAYDDSLEETSALFADQLWILLKYDPVSDGWSKQLANKVNYLLNSRQLLRFSDGQTYEVDLAIVTALDTVEFDAVRRLQGPWEDCVVPNDTTRYLRTEFQDGSKKMSVVAAAAPQMGMAMSAALTSKLIHNFRPKYLCMCGIAAGVEGKANIGDILAPHPSWDWGSGKRGVDKKGKPFFAPAPLQLPLSTDMRDRLKTFADSNGVLSDIQRKWPGPRLSHDLQLRVGPVASGAAVLADPNVVDDVKEQQRQLIGIEMEVFGVFTAALNCSKPRPTTFALKSVCDFGDSAKSDEHQAYAAFTSAEFLYRFALEELCE